MQMLGLAAVIILETIVVRLLRSFPIVAGKCVSAVCDQQIYLVCLLLRVFMGTKAVARVFLLGYMM